MQTEEKTFLQRKAEEAEVIADYLQILASAMLILTFSTGLLVLFQKLIGLTSGYSPSTLVSFLSLVLMISLLGSVVDQFRKPSRNMRIRLVIVIALIGTGIGVLEDWLGPTMANPGANISISLTFAIMIASLLVALILVQMTDLRN